MINLIINLLITSGISYFLANNLSGVHVSDFKSAFFFAITLGILNAIVKPLLSFFSFPITVLTLGLFLLVINATMVLLASSFIAGFKVDGFWWALIFSIVLSIITSFLNGILGTDL